MYSKKKWLLVGVVLILLVASGPFCGAGLVETGLKAESSSEQKASSAQKTSPLFTQSLRDSLNEWEAKTLTGGKPTSASQTAPGQVHGDTWDDFTFGSTCATHPTCTGSTCAIPTSAYSCAADCSNTFGTTCETCNPTCNPTCDNTCETTCGGTTCGGTTCDTTCGGTTCDTTCGGTTCDTTCGTDCQTPPPSPQPTAPSRNWGHDSVGTPAGYLEWYLAEGCTLPGYETWILVQNPFDKEANISLRYMKPEGGGILGPSATLPPGSRKSFNVSDVVPDAAEVSTRVMSDSYVIAERAMYGPGRAWGHDSIGSPVTSKKWYLAEGCTAGGFETWILLQNPGEEDADVSITYMTPEGPKAGPTARLPMFSRKTFRVADTVPEALEVSTSVSSNRGIVAERAVYWNNRKGGHESIGVVAPEKKWYLAEGSTAGGFETYVLIQNPGSSPASVDLTYMTDNGLAAGPRLDLPANSRKTVNVADLVPDTFNVSTKVTSNQPVIAERAVYWNNRIEGHDSIGVTEAAEGWALAEGSTGEGFETWVLVQNPNNQAADIEITYMTPGGPVAGPAETISPNSRKSYNVADTLPGEAEVSTMVMSTNGVKVISERAMYGDSR